MLAIKPKYITDEKGDKISAILPMKQYQKMIAIVEEFEDIILFDKSMEDKSKALPMDVAFAQIEERRRKNGL